jgi:polar amino acid transport system substrate-binding protein
VTWTWRFTSSRGAGVGDIRYVRTTFHELIPGLLDQRWHLTTAIFVTDDRAEVVDFSRPIWAMTDGFIVRRHNAARITSYEAIAAAHATLAVVVGQVQRETAIGTHSVTQFVGSLDQVLT